MALGIDDGLAGFHRTAENGRQLHGSKPEPDLAPADAGDVEQVVDQPGELVGLPLDDVAAPGELRIGERRGRA